jgi:predicted Zn-dependent peptidase
MKGELLAAYALSGSGGIMSEKALLDSISQITVADVQAVAKKLANGKLSMAAVGNLGTVPYLDTL